MLVLPPELVTAEMSATPRMTSKMTPYPILFATQRPQRLEHEAVVSITATKDLVIERRTGICPSRPSFGVSSCSKILRRNIMGLMVSLLTVSRFATDMPSVGAPTEASTPKDDSMADMFELCRVNAAELVLPLAPSL